MRVTQHTWKDLNNLHLSTVQVLKQANNRKYKHLLQSLYAHSLFTSASVEIRTVEHLYYF